MDLIQKQKKGKELEHQKTVKNVSMHQENDKKDQKKNHQFWVFSTSFNTISNVLNFLGVVLVSPITPYHKFC